jgi:flagellin-specific chaperone FliS
MNFSKIAKIIVAKNISEPDWTKVKTEFKKVTQVFKNLKETIDEEDTANFAVNYKDLLQNMADIAKYMEMDDIRSKLKSTIGEFD